MKLPIYILSVSVAAAALFTACHAGHDHDHEHDHDGDSTHEADADEHHHDADAIVMTKAQAKAAGLQTIVVEPSDFTEVTEVSGRILPAPGGEATVAATMSGIVRLANANLTDGAAVQAGQPLFVVAAHTIADGNPAAAAQSELEAARRAFERAEKLAQEQIVSQRELEDARQRYETARAAAQSLGSAAQTRGISSPMSGYVKNLLVRTGDYVTVGQAVATVTQSRRVQLRADVPERFYGRVGNVSAANFRMAYDESDRVYSTLELSGRLVGKGTTSDADGLFVPITFEFDNRGDIVAGSFAEIWLLGNVRSGVIAVPNEALTEAQGVYYVYVQEGDEAYRKQEVKVGATDGRRTEIVSGLKNGDRVVTHGATQVRLAASAGAVPEGHSH